ncbi:MAG: acetyl-CoA acetyltransferase [Proteobacteria bacterium]|nr:MAG: acetyl-CoA acetyltransferase [Pseudomonadota bacterium]
MPDAYIYDAVRTPRGKGKKSGSLYTIRPVELLAGALRALRDRNHLDTAQVDDVIMGCVSQIGDQGADIARFAALYAGYDQGVPGVTLNRFCGSGLEAVNQAATAVASGYFDMIVAGGVESMSRVPMGSDGGAIWDPDTQWRIGTIPQGISADLVATRYGISRAEADAFALRSQRRAAAAWQAGRFDRTVAPVTDVNGLTVLDRDELVRPNTTLEGLAALTPSFEMMGKALGLDVIAKKRYPEVEEIRHIHHAGNSSGIVDGAAAVLVATEAKGKAMGLEPRARIRSMAVAGTEPIIMLTGPMPATDKALRRAGMTIGDIDRFEVNEAFAAVPMAFMRHFDVGPDRVNVDGGSIAMGHPLGATGAVLLATVLDTLERDDLSTGLVTLCIGGGMGVATIIERV